MLPDRQMCCDRFVGLLLATKLLPAGDEHIMLKIYDAVGSSFITRLLLPLKSPKASYNSIHDSQRITAAIGLGLAVLAGLCRVPQLSAATEVVEKTPLFLKVVRAGGITPILQQGAPAHDLVQANAESADSHAVGDALDCLVQVVAAGHEGCTVALHSGGILAAAQALQAGVGTNQPWKATAVQLLGLLLSAAKRSESLAEASEVALAAVPALAQLFSAPADEASATGQTKQPPAGATSPPHSASSPADAAALHLEAMQVLLLLLPLPMPQAQEAASGLSAAAARRGEGWAGDIRSGLFMVLASRVGQQQRHSALRLAAALLELVQPHWLLGPVHAVAASGSLFQVLVEILKVETSLLLNDTMALLQPSTPSSPQESATSKEQPTSSQPASQSDNPSLTPTTDTHTHVSDTAHPAMDQLRPDTNSTSPSTVNANPMTGAAESSTSHSDLGTSSHDGQGDSRGGTFGCGAGPSSSGRQHNHCSNDSSSAVIGARVANVLPAVLSLLEGCLEALAGDAQDAELLASGKKQATSGPLLDDRLASRAMSALSEAFETVLQFLELMHSDASESSQNSPWLLAAIRAYGRFMAEVPNAHAKRLQTLLGWLVQSQGGAALPFLLPGLLLCSQPDADSLELAEPGTHRTWHQALIQPEVLTAVVQYVCKAAVLAEQATQAQLGGESDLEPGAEAELAGATALLLGIIGQEPASHLSQPFDLEVVMIVKPAVTALTAWMAGHQQVAAAEVHMDPGLAASTCLVCALCLHASSDERQESGQVSWSAGEAAHIFDSILWAMGVHFVAPRQSVSEHLEQMQLEGEQDLQDQAGLVDWDAVLEVMTTLVENNSSYQRQALNACWVRQCRQLDRVGQNLCLQLFCQASQA
ncbi:TPA: hypothetical protein ACH3X1_008824 [Trebouxia sp. C0004]